MTESRNLTGPRLRASEGEFAEVYALLEEGSAWLRGRGLVQWNPVYPRERFVRELGAGYVWYWRMDGKVFATVTLFPNRPEYYPDGVWDDAVPAWYVCRLAVSRVHAGAGVGRRILDQLEVDAARSKLRMLRLDVTASNPFLERYYRDLGYRRVASGEIKGGLSIFMEKSVDAKSV